MLLFIPFLWPLVITAIAVFALITLSVIKDKLQERSKTLPNGNAFKAMILKKKEHAVHVGIFDRNENCIDTVKYTSIMGVSDEVYKGQTIYL